MLKGLLLNCLRDTTNLKIWFWEQTLQDEQRWKQLVFLGQVKYPYSPKSLNPQDLHVGGFLLALENSLRYSVGWALQEKAEGGSYFIMF